MFWLIPSEGVGPHDTVIRVELRPQVPDWTGWIGSWRNRPRGFRFLVIADRPPPITPESNDLLILGASTRDAELGMRVLLMDLIYSNVLRRGAVRCGTLTVAEIVRPFAGPSIPIDSPLLLNFEMYWFHPGGVRVFTALEVPSIPEGSFVRVVEKANPCSNMARPLFPDLELLRWAEEQGTDVHGSEAEVNEDDVLGLLRPALSAVRDNTTLGSENVDEWRWDGSLNYGLL